MRTLVEIVGHRTLKNAETSEVRIHFMTRIADKVEKRFQLENRKNDYRVIQDLNKFGNELMVEVNYEAFCHQ
jgi:hypothetical protein